MKKIIFSYLLFFFSLFLIGCIENPPYTNDVLYECKEGTYSLPEEHLLKEVQIYFEEWDEIKEDNCVLYPTYNQAIELEKYYEMDTDECKLTMGQLAYLKEKQADIITALKTADCMYKTNLFLDKLIIAEPLDFKEKVKEIIGNFGASSQEFTTIFQDWTNGLLTSEEFQEAVKNEKKSASKTFKDLKDLQPKPEEQEIQTQAIKAVGLYIDSLTSFEEYLNTQSQEAQQNYDKKMDEATKEIIELMKLLE